MAATLTDSQGFFSLSRVNLPPDVYEIKAHLAGYPEVRSQVQGAKDKTTFLNLEVEKK